MNHSPIKYLQGVTLEEAWIKFKQNVSHFHLFGSEAWAHIPNEKWKALHPKSEKCIFVRYSEDAKCYRIIQLNSKYIIIRIDVKFDENISACEKQHNVPYAP